MNKVRENLLIYKERLQIDNEGLAILLNVSQVTIKNWLKRGLIPSKSNIRNIEYLLDNYKTLGELNLLWDNDYFTRRYWDGKKLNDWRNSFKSFKFYKKHLAKILSVTTSTLINWEMNRNKPTPRFIKEIHKLMKLSEDELKQMVYG